MLMASQRVAVVLFNLGGPDSLQSVEPFLYNLFKDPAILRLPWGIRHGLAKIISKRRAPQAQEIYKHLGGASPLLENTETQARALEKILGENYKVFIGMRYWRPRLEETVEQIKEWNPDKVVLLPLYPQFSTTTTQSSLDEWKEYSRQQERVIPTEVICCYPEEGGFVRAIAQRLADQLKSLKPSKSYRVLFTAHGLPQKIVDGGDPYPKHVEMTVSAVLKELTRLEIPIEDWVTCYQSRVGPLSWIRPYTDDEIHRAGREGLGVVIVPVAFVSEHSETLVELDIEYRALAKRVGVPFYHRIPTVSDHPDFIQSLARLVKDEKETVCIAGDKQCTCGGYRG